MSRAATDWAWGLELKAPQKILVLSLADRADEYHCCYPSIQRLVMDTGLDKKTIGKWINQMIEDGLISDTGERKGPTKRVRVLRLNIENKYTQKRDDSKNGNIPKNGCLNDPKFGCLNDPKFGSQNQSLEPTIETNTQTHKVGCVVDEKLTLQQKGTKPRARGTSARAKMPVFDRQRFKDTWNCKAEQYGLPKILSVTATHENGLKRLWHSYLKQCREIGREPKDIDSILNGYIEFGYTPTEWACGNNPEGKKYGIETAFRQEKIDQILAEDAG